MHNAMGAFQKFEKFSNFFHFCGGHFVGGAKRVIGHQKISFAKWKGLGLGLGLWIRNWMNMRSLFGKI